MHTEAVPLARRDDEDVASWNRRRARAVDRNEGVRGDVHGRELGERNGAKVDVRICREGAGKPRRWVVRGKDDGKRSCGRDANVRDVVRGQCVPWRHADDEPRTIVLVTWLEREDYRGLRERRQRDPPRGDRLRSSIQRQGDVRFARSGAEALDHREDLHLVTLGGDIRAASRIDADDCGVLDVVPDGYDLRVDPGGRDGCVAREGAIRDDDDAARAVQCA